MIHAVIFDMDGLLLDSERLARDAFVRACGELGLAVDLEVYHRCIGSTYEQTEAILTAHYGPAFSYDTVEARWDDLYHARLGEGPVPVKRGAEELLRHLTAAGIPLALVTSTRRPTAEAKLDGAGLLGFFDDLVCGGETERGKPDPDPYLAGARAIGVATSRCLALEDSANGVRAAHAAGCMVVQVPDLVPPTDELRRLGHRVLDDLTEVLALLRP